MNMPEKLFAKIEAEEELGADELVGLLSLEDGSGLERLFALADAVRKRCVGDEVHLRGLLEFSNYCRKNCAYCGIRRDNRKVRRYRMETGEIAAAAVTAAGLGYRTIVLQSGEDMHYSADQNRGPGATHQEENGTWRSRSPSGSAPGRNTDAFSRRGRTGFCCASRPPTGTSMPGCIRTRPMTGAWRAWPGSGRSATRSAPG